MSDSGQAVSTSGRSATAHSLDPTGVRLARLESRVDGQTAAIRDLQEDVRTLIKLLDGRERTRQRLLDGFRAACEQGMGLLRVFVTEGPSVRFLAFLVLVAVIAGALSTGEVAALWDAIGWGAGE